jgi:hypothetical protein
VAEAGVFAAADAVLDAGVGAVAGIEVGELAADGVGGVCGVAVAVAFFECVELGAGVGTFATHDYPHPGGVAGWDGEQVGDLDQRGVGDITDCAGGLDRGGSGQLGD